MKKILHVEDDPDIRELVKTALQMEGFEVISAAEGVRGIQLARSELPNLVLLDLMMPRMHGFTLCEEIRKDPLLSHIPLLVVSAKAYALDVKKIEELGATGYMKKPFTPEELIAKVNEVLNCSRLRVKFWGTRGSIATPGKHTIRYGGNTSCIEIRHGQTILMFDCGTGARESGLALNQEFNGRSIRVHVFVSHTHWDHIQGFPFFAPAYSPGNLLNVYSVRGADKSLKRIFTGQMDASYFPVSVGDMTANLEFTELEGPIEIGGAKISHTYLNHPGLAIGFRIDVDGRSIVYVTDHEPYCRMSGDNEHNRKRDREITDFAQGSDLYIREAQYTEEEYLSKRGWGHSTFTDALQSAHDANAQRLALYHHDPMHDDDTMDQIVTRCDSIMTDRNMSYSLIVASDNLEITV